MWSDPIWLSKHICVWINVFAVSLVVEVMTHRGQVFKEMTHGYGSKETFLMPCGQVMFPYKVVRTTLKTIRQAMDCWVLYGAEKSALSYKL